MKISECFENEHIKTYIKDGIIYMHYKQREILSLEIVQKAVEERLKLAENVTMPIFIDFRIATGATKEAKSFLYSSDGIKGLSAGAMFIKSPLVMLAFNFYMKFDTPSLPMKVFIDEEKALRWLEQFKAPRLN